MIWRWVLSIAALTVCSGVGLLWFASQLYAVAQTREVTYRYFSEALVDLTPKQAIVSWEPASAPLDREVGKAEQSIVGLAMTQAWQVFAVALDSRDAAILADHFTDVALTRASQAVNMANGAHMAVLDITAQPVFYHSDGSVLQVQADAVTARYVQTAEGLAFHDLSADTVVSTLINGAAGWKVALHERTDADPIDPAPQPHQIPKLAGINYYPADTPWTLFWPNLRRATLDADFALIKDLGGNAIRIFLQRDAFTGAALDENLPKLRGLLAAADRQGLWVVPTLFDMRGGYQTAFWAEDYLSLRRILPVLQEAQNIAYVDLKNEPDLDFEVHGRAVVEAWARTMLRVARQMAPEFAYTIGWATAEAAEVLMEDLDVISYHEYSDIDTTQQKLNAVRTMAGDKPVHITEIGGSSFELGLGFPSSPDGQADLLEQRMTALAEADGIFLWTLHDFPDPDPVAVGKSPWVRSLQGEYGVIAGSGDEKPAAEVVRAQFKSLLETENDE